MINKLQKEIRDILPTNMTYGEEYSLRLATWVYNRDNKRAEWLKLHRPSYSGQINASDFGTKMDCLIEEAFGIKPKTLAEKLYERRNNHWEDSDLVEIARTHFREHGLDAE